MNRQEAIKQYREALKQGQKCYKSHLLQGNYPYLQVLDEILDETMVAGQTDLGIIEIPTEQIVGTKTAGRTNAFAADFMPLFSPETEFAAKWINLCEAHLGDEGIRDPIRCYEYLGRFYVQEGNKRVSVMKSFGAPFIPGYVIRLVPVWSDSQTIRQYFEFLQSYELTKLYQIHFSQPGSFPKLQAALGYEPDHVWTTEERRFFLSRYTYFHAAYEKLGGSRLTSTMADALLVWLKVYSFAQLKEFSAAELQKSLSALWPDIKLLAEPAPIAVQTVPAEEEPGLMTRMVSAVFSSKLTVAFINELDPAQSPWVQAHMQGADHLEEALGDRIQVLRCHNAGTGDRAEQLMEEAIAAGAQVIFATTAPMINACRKIAARYPNVKILNCSISMPYTGVRTYYSRMFEGKFISGAIAGAMSRSDQLGYIANAPIFGVPAAINAFALGARLTNPRARIKLHWSCLPGNPMQTLAESGIDILSTLDVPRPDYTGQRGLCQVQPDGDLLQLAAPYWNWGAFYVRLVSSILSGRWDDLSTGKNGQAVNYWWGMASGVIGLRLNPDLPEGVRNLAQILQKGILDGSISPFHRYMRCQDDLVRNDGSQWFTPEEILHMDWLSDIVDGEIPSYDDLVPKARNLVRLLGIYRDAIPPEKESVLL